MEKKQPKSNNKNHVERKLKNFSMDKPNPNKPKASTKAPPAPKKKKS